MRPLLSIATLASLSLTLTAVAEEMANPALQAPHGTTASGESGVVHSWEMPAITVTGSTGSNLREEDRIGSYGQPRWTARRLFTETRSYVIPEGQFEFEYWLTVEDHARGDKDGTTPGTVKQQYEVEVGLPYRFQVDLYQTWEKEGHTGGNELAETKFEVRWALANWGVIWGNPTLYEEWANVSGGFDVFETKLLLCDELASHWHWGTNFVFEAETGGHNYRNYEMTNAISYTLQDERFCVGLEDKFAFEDVEEDRGDFAKEVLVGPMLQYRPLPQMHIDLAFLVGLTDESPVTKTNMIAGWEF
jgi:hypothetical protein